MSRQYVLPLVAAAALVYACGGPRPQGLVAPAATVPGDLLPDGFLPGGVTEAHAGHSGPRTGMTRMADAATRAVQRPGSAARAGRRAAGDTAALAATLAAQAVPDGAAGVRFALTVVNVSEHRLELTYPDGQTRDFAVYDSTGREVWRWSAGRMFTQMMQTRLLAAGDSVTYAERWTPPHPGRYAVVATLRSDNHPLARTVRVDVPAAGPPTVAVGTGRQAP